MPLTKRVLSRLAAASMALGATAVGATLEVPADVLAEWVEDDLRRSPPLTPLQAVRNADRSATRTRATVGALWSSAKQRVEALVQRMARDDSLEVRIGAAAGLGRMLELASPVERVELVCRWTLTRDARERVALARALALPTPVFVADLVIAELGRDEDHEVRAAAARALRTHFRTDPARFAKLASQLIDDPHPVVRSAARESALT